MRARHCVGLAAAVIAAMVCARACMWLMRQPVIHKFRESRACALCLPACMYVAVAVSLTVSVPPFSLSLCVCVSLSLALSLSRSLYLSHSPTLSLSCVCVCHTHTLTTRGRSSSPSRAATGHKPQTSTCRAIRARPPWVLSCTALSRTRT